MVNPSPRSLRRWLVQVVAAFLFVATVGRAQGPPTAVHIPTARGTSLAVVEMALPNSLQGKIGVLVVGFSHASQEQIADWGRLIEADYGKSAKMTYFEVAMIGSAPKLLRGVIVKSMAKAVPGAEKPHFVPLVEDDKPWRAVTHYDKPDDAYLLIVDGDGTVLWQTEGDATDAAYAGFKRQLDGMLAGRH